jgi:hypothetical protein
MLMKGPMLSRTQYLSGVATFIVGSAVVTTRTTHTRLPIQAAISECSPPLEMLCSRVNASIIL